MKFISEKCSWTGWIIFVTGSGNQTKEEVEHEEKIIRGYDGVYVDVCTGGLWESRMYLGFPNGWGDMPMTLYSFLDDYDLSGKKMIPSVISGGSGFSNTIHTTESMEPDAEVLDGLSLGSSQAANPKDAVADWLSGLGFAE
ncbi:MAG: hypothetical protein HFG60_10670 [Lachnospiraceae bacterium]|nr:hypothetical protein [Lachnospiraceae bacterium]